MKLKELAELQGVELPKLNDVSEIMHIEAIQHGTALQNLYDNLDIPIEKLRPSVEEIIEELKCHENCRYEIENKETLAIAIHNLKPGGERIKDEISPGEK